MKYLELQYDFNNIRFNDDPVIGNVLNEAQNYIEFLEEKQDLLENLLVFLNALSESPNNETKFEILEGLKTILPYE